MMADSRLAMFWVTGTPNGLRLAEYGRHGLGEEGLCRRQSALLPLSLVCHVRPHLLGKCLQIDSGGVKLGLSEFSQAEGCARWCSSRLRKASLREGHPLHGGSAIASLQHLQ